MWAGDGGAERREESNSGANLSSTQVRLKFLPGPLGPEDAHSRNTAPAACLAKTKPAVTSSERVLTIILAGLRDPERRPRGGRETAGPRGHWALRPAPIRPPSPPPLAPRVPNARRSPRVTWALRRAPIRLPASTLVPRVRNAQALAEGIWAPPPGGSSGPRSRTAAPSHSPGHHVRRGRLILKNTQPGTRPRSRPQPASPAGRFRGPNIPKRT